MSRTSSTLLSLGLVFVAAAGGAWLSHVLYSHWPAPANHEAHEGIHHRLDLTPEQERALAPIEEHYLAQKRDLEASLSLANRELAQAILDDGRDSERVHAAIEKIHADMGALQKVTIGHVFAMKEVLTPEQYRALLNLTAKALNNLDPGHGDD